jgi:hypothetical protein
MDFRQAEQAYQELEALLGAGELDMEAYRERLNELQVQDDQGRTWMLQERTGAWYVWNGEAWEAGEPPRTPEPTPPPMPAAPVQPQAVTPATGPAPEPAPAAMDAADTSAPPDRGKNIFGIVWRLVVWAAFWGFIGYFAIVEGEAETNAILVMVGVAIASLAFVLWNLTRVYEGVIERVRVEEETDTDEDGSTTTRNVTYAYIRTTEGKMKKVKAKKSFGRGDRVFKRVGDWGPRKVKA